MLPSAPSTPLAGHYDHHSHHNQPTPPPTIVALRIHHDPNDPPHDNKMVDATSSAAVAAVADHILSVKLKDEIIKTNQNNGHIIVGVNGSNHNDGNGHHNGNENGGNNGIGGVGNGGHNNSDNTNNSNGNTAKKEKESNLANEDDRQIMATVNRRTGLTAPGVLANRQQYGSNSVPTEKKSKILLFLSKFNNVTAWMLEIVVILAFVLGEYVNGAVIIALLLFNGIMSYHHDLSAQAQVEALKAKLRIEARVLRESKWEIIGSADLVPADIIRLRIGDVVPADVVIIDGDAGIDQSALTGETVLRSVTSVTPAKIFGGSIVKRGELTAIVVATGASAAFGKTVQLIQSSKPKGHADLVMVRVARSLFAMVGFTMAIAIFVLLGQQDYDKLVDVLPLLLVLMVSAIPVALPAMWTTTMALGSMELTRRGVIMSRLNASEDAAGMTVLCSDKTGTITKNELSVKAVTAVGHNTTSLRVLLVAALASRAENHDPTDLAFLRGYAQKLSEPGTPRITPHSPQTIEAAAATAGGMPSLQLPSSTSMPSIAIAASNDSLATVSGPISSSSTESRSGPLPPVDSLPLGTDDVRVDLNGGIPKRQLSMLSSAAAALSEYSMLHFTPFDATIRRTESIVEYSAANGVRMRFRAIKGALNTVLSISEASVMTCNHVSQLADQYASKGFRSLAVACTTPIPIPSSSSTSGNGNGESRLSPDDIRLLRAQRPEFLGVVALHDPPRDDSASIIAEIQKLGVAVKMLTGDATPVARETGSQVGLNPSKIIDVAHLREATRRTVAAEGKYKTSEELEIAVDSRLWSLPELDVEKADGFGEIFPQDKHFVVTKLQKMGYIVGMTGDGVNDAPALKKAEVGVAVANATDVAKGAASAVMLAEGLSGIPHLIRIGRRIHSRIVTWVLNKSTRTFLTAGFVVIAFLYSGKFVVSTFHMILMIFLIDFVTLSLATDTAHWSRVPDHWNIKKLATIASIIGLMNTGQMLALWELARLWLEPSDDELQTFSFLMLYLFSVMNTFSFRERGRMWHSIASKPLLYTCSIETVAVLIICCTGIPHAIEPLYAGAVFALFAACAIIIWGFNDYIKMKLLTYFGVH